MKLIRGNGVSLAIVLDNRVEVRFTPNGDRLASWPAVAMPRLRFELWAEKGCYGSNCEHSKCDSVNRLAELFRYAGIIVHGNIREHTYRNRDGEPHRYSVFTVDTWEPAE